MRRGLGSGQVIKTRVCGVPVAAGWVVDGSIFFIVPIQGRHNHSLYLDAWDQFQSSYNLKISFILLIFSNF